MGSDCSTDLQGRLTHTFYKLTVSSRTQKLENVQIKEFNSEERLETQKMVEAVITNLEIKDHDEEELEPLDSPPPAPLILCCEWIAMKICGYSPPDKEEPIISETGGKTKR